MTIRAALTGHLVFSTLHTNDAVSTISRLVDIGIPSYLVTASLRLIIAQRLIRKLCSDCKEPYEIKKEDISDKIVLSSPVIYRAKGCDKCNYIGYNGRSSISEIIFLDEEVRSFINKGASPDEIMKLAQKKGTLTLLQSGLKRVEEGITSLEEILSITANY